jgi:hypothetical protein
MVVGTAEEVWLKSKYQVEMICGGLLESWSMILKDSSVDARAAGTEMMPPPRLAADRFQPPPDEVPEQKWTVVLAVALLLDWAQREAPVESVTDAMTVPESYA